MNTLPNDLELEKAIIVNCFQNGKCYDDLSFDDFYIEQHKNLYKTIEAKNFDICETSAKKFKYDLNFLMQIIEEHDMAFVNENSIEKIKDLSFRRKAILKHQEQVTKCYDVSTEPEDVFCLSVASEGEMLNKDEIVKAVNEDIKSFKQIKFRFKNLCKKIPSINHGNVFAIAGRSGTGKSAFAIQLVDSIATSQDEHWAFFSLEMPRIDVCQRFSAIRYWAECGNNGDEYASNQEWFNCSKDPEYLQSLLPHRMFLRDNSRLDVKTFRNVLRKLISKNPKVKNVLIDYLQLMFGKGNNRNEIMGEIARELKRIAKEFGIRLFYVSQLSRKAEDGSIEPFLHHLRDSGDIEEACDGIIFLWRPRDLQNNLMLKVGKYRMGGSEGWCPLKRYGVYFEDPEPQEINQWMN